MKTPVFLVIVVFLNSTSGEGKDGKFLDKFRYGIELVRRLFDASKGEFGTFFTSFGNREHKFFSKRDRDDFTRSLLGAIIKSMAGSREEMTRTGLKISVLVAKVISDSFVQTGRVSRGAAIHDFSPLNTLFRQAQVKDLMTMAKDPNLMGKVTEEFSGEGNDCLQLLLCKLTPFVRGMQKSLSFFAGTQIGQDEERETWAKSKPIERMYLFLPGMKEFVDECDVNVPTETVQIQVDSAELDTRNTDLVLYLDRSF